MLRNRFMGNNKKTRSSNMELLRVLAMIMIVIYHIGYHCVLQQLYAGGNAFCEPVFFKKLLLLEAVMPFGSIANSIFILVSGYFMVEKGPNFNIGGIAKKLLLQMGFVVIVMMFATTIYYNQKPVDYPLGLSFFYVTDFNTMNWFVGYYFIIITVAYIFLNKYLENLERKKYTNFLFILLGLFSFMWSARVLNDLSDGVRTVFSGIFLYSLGGYIKKYDPFGKIRTWCLIAIIIVVNLLIGFTYYNTVQSNIHSYIMGGATESFIQPIIEFDNSGIAIIIIPIALLEIFKRITIPTSRVINYLGASTFMVYLIHDNEFFWGIWRESDWINLLSNSTQDYLIRTFVWAMFTFALGVIAYTVFVFVGKLLNICRGLIYAKD